MLRLLALLRRQALLAPLLVTLACRVTATSVPRDPAGPGWSRVVIHASMRPPVGLRLTSGAALTRGFANPGGELPLADVERVDAFPVGRPCRLGSVCTLWIRHRLMAVVFAFDPIAEVDIVPPSGKAQLAAVRYREPNSISAKLGDINERSIAIEVACHDHTLESADRRKRAAPLERELRKIATDADRTVVQRAASLALVQTQCTGAPENRALAKRLLDTLEPTAPELGPWTTAVRSLGALTGEPARAEALVDAVIERHPDPAVGAWLLFLRQQDLGDDGDPRALEAIERQLESPRFAKTAAAAAAGLESAAHDSVALAAGDKWPAIDLASVSGGTIDVAAEGTVLVSCISARRGARPASSRCRG
jgi:hypothetical protein